MVRFTTVLHQFAEQGEKTGWTYIALPADLADQLNPGSKKSFRVKGKLDQFAIKSVAVLPMGDGSYILPVNGAMRKGIGKKKGAMVKVQLSLDKEPLPIPPAFLECLNDEPVAKSFFESLKLSQRNYFIKWLGGVKGEQAMAGRIAQAIDALALKQDFVTMIRAAKAKKSSG